MDKRIGLHGAIKPNRSRWRTNKKTVAVTRYKLVRKISCQKGLDTVRDMTVIIWLQLFTIIDKVSLEGGRHAAMQQTEAAAAEAKEHVHNTISPFTTQTHLTSFLLKYI